MADIREIATSLRDIADEVLRDNLKRLFCHHLARMTPSDASSGLARWI